MKIQYVPIISNHIVVNKTMHLNQHDNFTKTVMNCSKVGKLPFIYMPEGGHTKHHVQFKKVVQNISSNQQTGKCSLQEWAKWHHWVWSLVFEKKSKLEKKKKAIYIIYSSLYEAYTLKNVEFM